MGYCFFPAEYEVSGRGMFSKAFTGSSFRLQSRTVYIEVKTKTHNLQALGHNQQICSNVPSCPQVQKHNGEYWGMNLAILEGVSYQQKNTLYKFPKAKMLN